MKTIGNGIELIAWDSDPLTEPQLAEVESAIGPLPADYRNFLLTTNGGRMAADDVRLPLSELVHSDYLPVSSIEAIEAAFPPAVLPVEVEGERLGLIRIAECADSPYLLQLNGSHRGAVYFWSYQSEDHWAAEEAGREYLPDQESLLDVAPSFADFVGGLIAAPQPPVPELKKMERSAENFAKYGDQFFAETKGFFDALTLDEINESEALTYAANWSQVRTSKLLIERGVDLHTAVMYCTNSLAITRLMIDAGATKDELQTTLLSAATGIAATSVPEEHHDIIMFLLDRGIRPDFNNPSILEQWQQGMGQIYGKKILAFLLRVIDFPTSIAEPMRARIAKRA